MVRGRKKKPSPPEDEKEVAPPTVKKRARTTAAAAAAGTAQSTGSVGSAGVNAATKATASKARKPPVKKTKPADKPNDTNAGKVKDAANTTNRANIANTTNTTNTASSSHGCCFSGEYENDWDLLRRMKRPYPFVGRFSDFNHRGCAFDLDHYEDDDSDDCGCDDCDGCERCDEFFGNHFVDDGDEEDEFFDSDEEDAGLDQFLYRDNVSVVESYLRNYAQRPGTTASARSRISDFFLFLRTLSTSQVPDAFGLLRSEFADMDSLDNFPSDYASRREGMLDPEISRLPRHSYRGQTQKEKRTNEDPHKCCICMAELELGEELILLEKCAHRFHSGCLESWLRRSNKCPICRATVNPPPLIIN